MATSHMSRATHCLLLCAALFVGGHCSAVRGLNPQRKESYSPGKVFSCLDGSATIPFSHINDDYCDCRDGSDEPGTAACPNGSFYCPNVGHEAKDIISSRVNDGVCDCCDGSDEYESGITCTDTCVEMGKKAVEEAKRLRELHEEGYQKRQEYSKQGAEKIDASRVELQEKQARVEAMKNELDELRAAKELAEEPEREAKEKHKLEWEAVKEERKEEKRNSEARMGFDELDTDSNGLVSVEELQARPELDDDGDGEVSEAEALEYLDNYREMEFPAFLDSVWDLVSDKCQFQKPARPVLPTIPPPEEEDRDEDYDYDDEDEEEEEVVDVYDTMPEFDEETKQLIAAADEARDAHSSLEREKNNLELEITKLNKFLEMDFGAENQFTSLYDNCYEYSDLEYTYKMCAFSKVTQKPKNGGRETSLGLWGSWKDSGVMLYDNGEKCWNGPSRSATITLTCGLEDALVSASEPNRCEYAMQFTSPAVCQSPKHPHTEL